MRFTTTYNHSPSSTFHDRNLKRDRLINLARVLLLLHVSFGWMVNRYTEPLPTQTTKLQGTRLHNYYLNICISSSLELSPTQTVLQSKELSMEAQYSRVGWEDFYYLQLLAPSSPFALLLVVGVQLRLIRIHIIVPPLS